MTRERGLRSWDRAGQFRGVDLADLSAGWRQGRRAAGLVVFPDWPRSQNFWSMSMSTSMSWASRSPSVELRQPYANSRLRLGFRRSLAPSCAGGRVSQAVGTGVRKIGERGDQAPEPGAGPAASLGRPLDPRLRLRFARRTCAEGGRGRPPFWEAVLLVKQFGVFRAGSLNERCGPPRRWRAALRRLCVLRPVGIRPSARPGPRPACRIAVQAGDLPGERTRLGVFGALAPALLAVSPIRRPFPVDCGLSPVRWPRRAVVGRRRAPAIQDDASA